MKAWRNEGARTHNIEAGMKHQGRKNRGMFILPKMPSDLMIKLMSIAGMIVIGSPAAEMAGEVTGAF